jgi:O-antigen/teichoic acid export membrane protein
MTTALSNIPYKQSVANPKDAVLDGSTVGRGAKLMEWIHRNIWAMGDQILISAANFITMVLAARAMQKTEFGSFTLVYSALLLANVLQSTLITQAHNVLGATRDGLDYRVYTSTTAMSQLMFLALEGIVASAIAVFAWMHHSAETAMLIALVPAIVGWQLQEFVRRVLYTEGRLAAAFANDIVSYAGQTVWVVVLWRWQTLTGASALYALAWTSVAAALWGVWQLRGSLIFRFDSAVIWENWRFGKWLAGAEIVGWCSSLHMYLYLAALFIGTAATGELKAAQLIFGPTRMLAFFLGNVLPIRFARDLARGGDSKMHAGLRTVVAAIAPLLGSYCLLAAIFASRLMRFLYGANYAGDASVLQLYALCAFLNYMQMVVAAALSAKRLTHLIFTSSVYGGVIALALSWFLIKLLGIDGAVVCMMLTAVIVSILYVRAYRKNVSPVGEPKSNRKVGLAA